MRYRRCYLPVSLIGNDHEVLEGIHSLVFRGDTSLPLSPRAIAASEARMYNNQVVHGGHYQYLRNLTESDDAKVIQALFAIGVPKFAQILSRARAVYARDSRAAPKTLEEIHQRTQEGVYIPWDDEFRSVRPTLEQSILRFVRRHLSDFFTLDIDDDD